VAGAALKVRARSRLETWRDLAAIERVLGRYIHHTPPSTPPPPPPTPHPPWSRLYGASPTVGRSCRGMRCGRDQQRSFALSRWPVSRFHHYGLGCFGGTTFRGRLAGSPIRAARQANASRLTAPGGATARATNHFNFFSLLQRDSRRLPDRVLLGPREDRPGQRLTRLGRPWRSARPKPLGPGCGPARVPARAATHTPTRSPPSAVERRTMTDTPFWSPDGRPAGVRWRGI